MRGGCSFDSLDGDVHCIDVDAAHRRQRRSDPAAGGYYCFLMQHDSRRDVERRLRGKSSVSAIWESFAWLWDNSNVIGIPILVLGAVYLIWAMNYGPGLGGPTLLIVLLMGAATALVGLAPSLRRR